MSEVRLVLRDRERSASGTIHGSMADYAVAALSAEPETIDELEIAIERFHRPCKHGFFASLRPRIVDEPYDAGLVVIDLAARLIVCDSTYSSPAYSGAVNYHDGDRVTKFAAVYRLPDDWNLRCEAAGWKPFAEELRQKRLAESPFDTRSVLLGNEAIEFIVRECFAAFRNRPAEQLPSESFYGDEFTPDDATAADFAAIREIHARWLSTPRDDLRGQAPRDLLLEKKQQIGRDIQHRSSQWSRMLKCPRPLEKTSWAYRFAGFGTHQIVVYYYLTRFLLWSCYRSLVAVDPAQRAMMSVGDFLAVEMPRLAEAREAYLDTLEAEYSGRTPRAVMENERSRIPEGVSGHEAMIDCDCPLCQMQAELPGPEFWGLDGCNMDDDFAFSFHRTRTEWEQEQREHEEWNRKWEIQPQERSRLGVSYPGGGYADPNYVWKRSFIASESEDTSLRMRLFAIGTLLSNLKEPTENRRLIDCLRRDWGNLREVVGATHAGEQPALIEAVLNRFCESLAEVAEARSDLEPKCSDLTRRLRRFLEPSSETNDDLDFECSDDLPF